MPRLRRLSQRLLMWGVDEGSRLMLHGTPPRLATWRSLSGLRAAVKTAIFLLKVLKVFRMLPSRPVDWVTAAPVIERLRYPTHRGEA
jgi:hypothetical protein